MTDAIYTWMRNLAVFYILLTVVMNLLPDNSYREYIRFFMGVLLLLLVITPIINLLDMGDTFRSTLQKFQQEQANLEMQMEDMEMPDVDTLQEEYLQEGYRREAQELEEAQEQ